MHCIALVTALAAASCESIDLADRADQGIETASVLGGPSQGWGAARIRRGGGVEGPVILSDAAEPAGEEQVYRGTGEFVGEQRGEAQSYGGDNDEEVTLNLVDVGVREAAKSILGDVLGVNYSVDEKATGTVTIQTSAPVKAGALVDMFGAVLRAKGLSLVADNGFYRIVSSEAAFAGGLPIKAGAFGNGAPGGVSVQVVPLRYVAAKEMERVLTPIAAKGAILQVDPTRNVIVLSGTGAELATMREAIAIFDIDWMRGMSFGLFPVSSSDPESIAKELDTIFANDQDGPAKGIVRFIPNKRLRAVLVISSQPAYLDRAAGWLAQVDQVGKSTEKELVVYNVQNRQASELARLLQRIYATEGKGRIAVSTASERDGRALTASGTGRSTGLGGTTSTLASVPAGTLSGVDPLAAPDQGLIAADRASSDEQAGPASGERDGGPPISIVADESNNALLILASPTDYKRIVSILERIDEVPNQVLLEATIAEVTLNDELKFGLRWFFERGQSEFSFTDAATGVVGPVFPGFSYFLNSVNVKVALNALNTVTDVDVISSPTLMVLDNKTAVLQVGDEVPIATQSAVSVVSPDSPIVNAISFRNTGVILSITPRVNDSGRVLLEIEQEVSDVVATTSSKIDSPTIQQRRIKTTVAVQDGESLALGGLIQERNSLAKDQVPIAGDIPVVGNLFKNKSNKIRRTELLVIITPRVVRDRNEARAVTDEFRRQVDLSTRPHGYGRPDRHDNIKRVAQ